MQKLVARSSCALTPAVVSLKAKEESNCSLQPSDYTAAPDFLLQCQSIGFRDALPSAVDKHKENAYTRGRTCVSLFRPRRSSNLVHRCDSESSSGVLGLAQTCATLTRSILMIKKI